jgi:hypothetical protein
MEESTPNHRKEDAAGRINYLIDILVEDIELAQKNVTAAYRNSKNARNPMEVSYAMSMFQRNTENVLWEKWIHRLWRIRKLLNKEIMQK